MNRRRAFRIPTVCAITGLGRSTIYAAIKTGDLIARKLGRCTLILEEDLRDFLHALPKSNDMTEGRKGR